MTGLFPWDEPEQVEPKVFTPFVYKEPTQEEYEQAMEELLNTGGGNE